MSSTDRASAGLSRRRFIGAGVGAAGAVALGGLKPLSAIGGNGLLVPKPKRSIILYTVRDRIGATRTRRACRPASRRCSSDSPRSATATSSSRATPARQREGGNVNNHAGASCCRAGSTTTGSRPRATTATIPGTITEATLAEFDAALRDREHPRLGYIGTGGDPTGQQLRARLEARRRALEHPRRAGRPPRPQAVHAQPRCRRTASCSTAARSTRWAGRRARAACASWSTSWSRRTRAT